MEYLLHILVMACLFSALSISFDHICGHAGMLSVAHAAFFGIGAYSCAIVTTRLEVPFVIGICAAIIISALLSLLVSLPSLRLRADFFVVATFAFHMVVGTVLNNWISLTRGPYGITDIPRPNVCGWLLDGTAEYACFCLGWLVLVQVFFWRVNRSAFGRVLRAIRENESFAQAAGNNTVAVKVVAVALGSCAAAVTGGIFAHYVGYIDPRSFSVMESILIISMLIIGGAGSTWGPLIGAFLLVLMPEGLRAIGLSSTAAASMRQIIYGVMLIVIMQLRPHGIAGRYDFGE